MDAYSYLALAVFIISALLLLYLVRKLKSSSNNDINHIKKTSAKHNYLLFLYKIYRDTPILNRYLVKVRSKVDLLYPADSYSSVEFTSRILLKGTFAGFGGIVATLLISNGDIFFICSGLMITFILITATVNLNFEKLEDTLLEQFANFLSSIRHKYHEYKIVETAISATMDDLPYEIGLHVQNIYNIVISPNMRYEIDRYVSSAPNKYVLMFLSICASVKEYGDKELEDGASLFLTDLNFLKEEVNNERLTKQKNKNAFASLTTLALAPVMLIKPLEIWAVANMPDIAQYYGGIYGIVAMVAIFISSFVTYMLIVALRDKEKEIEKETDIFAKVSQTPGISEFLNKIISKEYRKYEEIDNDLQSLGDHTGPKAFIFKRIIIAITVFASTVLVLFGSGVTQKLQYSLNWSDAFEEAVVPNDEYRDLMREMGQEYMSSYLNNGSITEEDLTNIIVKEKGSRINYAQTISKEVIERINKYQNSYFRWWYLIVAFLLAYVGYMSPVLMIRFKKNIIQMRKQEEVVQFQSLMLILMHMDGITVAEILEWMERFGYCFREDIAECRVNLSHGEKEALINLRDSQRYEPFRDFVENLLSIDRVGVTAAFDEIKTDREYYKEDRKEQSEKNIQNKSSWAKLIAFVPFGLTVLLYLLIPLVVYAISMLQEMSVLMS